MYSLGREIGKNDDGGWIDLILKNTEERGGSLRELLLAIVESEPFRSRRGVSAEGAAP